MENKRRRPPAPETRTPPPRILIFHRRSPCPPCRQTPIAFTVHDAKIICRTILTNQYRVSFITRITVGPVCTHSALGNGCNCDPIGTTPMLLRRRFDCALIVFVRPKRPSLLFSFRIRRRIIISFVH